jgi:PAS domain S-box-containing protein
VARDVTALYRTEAALDKTEHRLRVISDVLPQIIWENDGQGKAIYFNKRWFEYSGKTQEQSEGPGWPLISHTEDHHAISAWKESLAAGHIFESEARLRRADGVYRWHLLRNVPLKDEAGALLSWYGSATDVDKLRKTEISLQETSQKLRAILEAAVDFAIISLDLDGNITDWNSGAEKIFHYSRREAIGRFTDLIFTPEDKHGNIPAVEIERAAQTGRSVDERWHLRKDGSRFFMSGVLTPIYAEEHKTIKGYVKIARDITDRKLAEEALFLSEQRKSVMLQSTEIGEWEWDIISDTVQRSDHASLLLGLQPGASYEEAKSFFSLIYQDDLSIVKQQLAPALGGLNVFQAEFRILRADTGQARWVNAYGRVIAHRQEQPMKMIGVIYDISDRKLQEKHKDDFISIASHELKTPVTSIQVYSDLLEDILMKSSTPQHAELVSKLNNQVARLVRLIYSLLDYTNIAEGRMKLFPQPFDLNQLIAEQVQELGLASPSHKLVWKPAAIALVHADRERIRQVLVNFISNAVKYSPAGSEVIITTEDELDGVKVRFRDFGGGIRAEEQARIFQRYYRVQSKEMENNPGLGLGLYISSEIIKQHMGSIGVESLAGDGSTFYFKLPYS